MCPISFLFEVYWILFVLWLIRLFYDFDWIFTSHRSLSATEVRDQGNNICDDLKGENLRLFNSPQSYQDFFYNILSEPVSLSDFMTLSLLMFETKSPMSVSQSASKELSTTVSKPSILYPVSVFTQFSPSGVSKCCWRKCPLCLHFLNEKWRQRVPLFFSRLTIKLLWWSFEGLIGLLGWIPKDFEFLLLLAKSFFGGN